MLIIRDTDPDPDEEGSDAYSLGTNQGISQTRKKRPQDQTNEEWLADYCSADEYRAVKSGEYTPRCNGGKNEDAANTLNALHQDNQHALVDHPAVPTSTANDFSPAAGLCFRYIDHRTTRIGSGCVALTFESLDGRIKATAFFNASLKSNRGNSYPSGKRGQFVPRYGSNFRTFWKVAVGKPPVRWCRVHKYMRSNLRDIIFDGTLTEETDGKGQRYFKLRNVEPRK